MFPVHQFDLYPRQRNQMQSAPHCYRSFEAIPPQMRADPDRLCNQSWPCSSSYGYVYPAQFHGCCEHNHFPGYNGLRSPYPQPPSPYSHGSYPVRPGAYPIHYIPPPYQSLELPRYEFDKDMRGYCHCCGCPNHPCNRKAGKNVKIEEEGLDLENKVGESSVPVSFKNYPNPLIWYSPNNIKNKEENRSNELQHEKQEDGFHGSKIHYPHPIVWFPPNYIMNKEDGNTNEPQCEKQGEDSSSAKTNYPYPLLWFPPMNVINKDDSISNEPQYEKQGGSSNCSKTREKSEPSEQRGNFLNGWFPFDMNNLRTAKSLSETQQQQQQGDDKPGFPCPVFWMPYKPDEREIKDRKRTGVDQESAQRESSQFEVSPVIVPETEENNKREVNEENIGHKGPELMEKNNILKTIPVKQVELKEEEKNSEKTKSPGIPLSGSAAGKSSADGGKRKSPSPPKSSKLPPVCLRVDPLPRKKNANGSSRSPSPPVDKGKSREMSRESVKPATSVDAKEITQQEIPPRNAMPDRAKDKEQHRGKIKTIQVSEGTGSQVGIGDSLPGSSHEGFLESQTNVRPRDAVDDLDATDVKCKSVAEEKAEDRSTHEKSKAEEKPASKAQEPTRINLSEAEAACIIQSAYRGYEVRRWEPLKKLKQVEEVRKKVAELNSSFQAFESSSDVQDVEKWRTVIGEAIMNLLLKLDTIQGMHPSIRDIRKSVARELVGLQEKVDYLIQKKAETLSQQASTVLSAENIDHGDRLCIKEGQEEEKRDQENSQSETDPLNEFHQEVACQDESNPLIHAVTNSGSSDIPEVMKDDGDNPWESITEATATEIQKGDPGIGAFTNSPNPDIPVLVTDEGENPGEPMTEPGSADTELQKSVLFPQVGDQTINPALVETCSSLKNEVSEVKVLEELPNGELGEGTCMQDNIVQHELGEGRAPEDEVLMNELPKGVLGENTDIQDNNLVKNEAGENQELVEGYLESKELVQLSQGVLDDNDNRSNKHLHVVVEEDNCRTGAGIVDVNAEGADGGVLSINQTEPGQETTLKMPVTSEVNESLGCAEDVDNNVELLGMVDLGSKDAVQAAEEQTRAKSNAADEPEMHGKEGTGLGAEVFHCAKGEVSEDFTAENEIPRVTATIEPKKASETCKVEVSELSFTATENGCTSRVENRLSDANNSSSKDTSREGDFPVKLSKSCDVEREEKQLNDNFELTASGEAAGVDRIYAQTCDSGALKGEFSVHVESAPLEANNTEEEELPPSSPIGSQISLDSNAFSVGDKKLIEENVRLREMMQKLIEAGQEQLTAISNLFARVKDLEKRISKKKKLKVKRNGTSRSLSGSSCLKPLDAPLKEQAVGWAM